MLVSWSVDLLICELAAGQMGSPPLVVQLAVGQIVGNFFDQ